MTTTTITPEILVISRSSRATSLLKAFWLKTKGVTGLVFGTAKGYGNTVLAAVPAPIAALAFPVVLATRWGYSMFGRAVGFVARLAGKVVVKAAQLVHQGIDMAGDLLCGVVDLFSPSAAIRLGDGLARFGEMRLAVSQFIVVVAYRTYDLCNEAWNAPWTRRVVMATAAFVAGVTLFGILAPGTFAALIAHLPVGLAFWISGIAGSGSLGARLIVQVIADMFLVYAVRWLYSQLSYGRLTEPTIPQDGSSKAVPQPEMAEVAAKAGGGDGETHGKGPGSEEYDAMVAERNRLEREVRAGINKPSPTKRGKRSR